MVAFYADASALCKRYVGETGSAWLQATLDPTTGCRVFLSRVGCVECVATISRRERGGSL